MSHQEVIQAFGILLTALMAYTFVFVVIMVWIGDGSQWQWVRKRRGGHWELWYLDHPACGEYWFNQAYCQSGDRPVLGRGQPTCEDYS